ncbi:MAG: single-stranded-DNA-specific exonuclease RecJ [Bacillota bacterium]
MAGQKWRLAAEEPVLRTLFVRELDISPITAQCLINRGVWSLHEAAEFLAGETARLESPWLLKDIGRAVVRIKEAVAKKERILIYGDYDADGVTAAALLFLTLKRLGSEPVCHLPSREEGYGLKEPVLRHFREEGFSLVITVDCGTSACREALLCRELGIDLVITDHHQPGPELPDAAAVVNPKQPGCLYPYKHFAGVGVAWKLATALMEETMGNNAGSMAEDLLDLVAIGTVADVVPLTGENRVLVRAGLKRVGERTRPGLRALLRQSAAGETVTARTVSMILAPRINAAGRVGDPRTALDLLLSEEENAEEGAALLCSLNQERQRLETLMLAEAQALIDGKPGEVQKPVLVVAGEGWLPGLTGIVANRLVERYGRPVFLIALNGESGRGSGRGTPGYDVFQALQYAAPHLVEYGGHTGAGGFTVMREAVAAFGEALIEYSRLEKRPAPVSLHLDADVKFEELTPELATELDLLEPHGCGNPPVRLVSYGVGVEDARPVGANGSHLKLRLRQGNTGFDAIAFGLAGNSSPPRVLDVVFRPAISEVTGRLELIIEDFRPAEKDSCTPKPYGANIFIKQALDYISQLTDLYRPEEAPEKQQQPAKRAALVDMRGHPDRWAVLAQMYSIRKPVVLVSTPAAACEVAARLRLVFPDTADRVTVFHAGLPEKHRAAAATAAAGDTGVLVTTPALAGRFPDDKDVVVFELFHTWSQWEWLRGCGGRELILLFGGRDREAARLRLNALAPPRKALLGFYQYLRRHAGRGIITIGFPDGVKLLKNCGVPGAGKRALENALKILAELELLELNPAAGGYRIGLKTPQRKRFLPASPTFKQQHVFKREVLDCQKHFLTSPSEVLKDYFQCGIISTGGTDDVGTLRRTPI